MIISCYTDVGRIRKENQDAVFAKQIDDSAALLIVADGMGGHRGGKTASSSAIERIAERILSEYRENLTGDEAEDLLRIAVFRANESIYDASFKDSELSGMGTTVVAALIMGNMLYTANVGDSRLYILSNGVLKQITTDHSYVESLVSKGIISKDEAKVHPQKNIITRALGSESLVDIDIFKTGLANGDTILLCSDGLYGAVSDEDISNILNKDISQASRELVTLANENGGRDNISAIAVKIIDEENGK